MSAAGVLPYGDIIEENLTFILKVKDQASWELTQAMKTLVNNTNWENPEIVARYAKDLIDQWASDERHKLNLVKKLETA